MVSKKIGNRRKEKSVSQNRKKRHPFLYLVEPLALRWGLSIIIQLIVIAFVGMEKAENYLMETTILVSLITILVFGKIYQRERENEGASCRKKNKLAGKDILAIVMCGIFICISLNSIIIWSGISQYSETYQTTSQSIYGASVFVQLAGVAFLAPVAEELVYRGMLYRRMRSMLPLWMSVLGSAIIFGVNHGNIVQFIFALITGAVMAYLYEVYGSLKASILFHVTLNMTSLVCTWLNIFSMLLRNFYFWIFATFGLMMAAIVMILYFVKAYSQNVHE